MKIMSGYVFKSKDTVISKPPTDKYKIVNIYVDPVTGKTVIEYNTTPQ